MNDLYTLTAHGFYIYTGDAEDKAIQKVIRDKGVWDPALDQWMSRNIKPGFLCLDIGANNGYFTEHMAKLSGPSGAVYGFEASKRFVDLYEAGRSLNSYKGSASIKMINTCLSNSVSSKTLFTPPGNKGGASLETEFINGSGFKARYGFGEEVPSEVECVPLRDIFDMTPDYIKIDVEGHEKQVFEGFSEKTLMCPLLTIEFTPYITDDFFQYLCYMYDFYDLYDRPLSKKHLELRRKVWTGSDVVLRRK